MTDTNGRISPDHLIGYQGVNVSRAIYPNLAAAGTEFRQRGNTFSIATPWGGNRPYDIQAAMRAAYYAGNYAAYNLSRPPSPPPAPAGQSRHGFALAVDVISNASITVRDQIMANHGFHIWDTNDRNHYEPDWLNVLTAPPESAFAGGDGVPLLELEEEMTHIVCQGGSPHFADGQRFLLTDGPLRILMPGEQPIYDAAGVPAVPVPAATLEQLLSSIGMWEYASTGTATPGPLTGRILGGPSGVDAAGHPVAAYPKVNAATVQTPPAQDNSAVLAAIASLAAKVPTRGTLELT